MTTVLGEVAGVGFYVIALVLLVLFAIWGRSK